MLAHPIWECSHLHWRLFHPNQQWNYLSLKVNLWLLSIHSMMFQYGMAASRSATFPIEKPRHLLDDSFLESQSPVRHDPHTTFASNGLSLGMYTLWCIHGQDKDCLHRWGKREDKSHPDGSVITHHLPPALLLEKKTSQNIFPKHKFIQNKNPA